MGRVLRAADRAGVMRPDRRGKSKWVKVLPWYYTRKRKRSRATDRRDAVRADVKASE